jgi:xanthosine utilization system XapX-like protein
VPPFHQFADLLFVPVPGWFVVALVGLVGRQVLLVDPAVGMVMRVLVAHPVTE